MPVDTNANSAENKNESAACARPDQVSCCPLMSVVSAQTPTPMTTPEITYTITGTALPPVAIAGTIATASKITPTITLTEIAMLILLYQSVRSAIAFLTHNEALVHQGNTA